ncbi:MAG: ribosome assembly RNA-binding protein YhbY [Firmicutes bacterium]|nr:ribosome assembly RNA-binding protein YhbY [Bacillota bacterium]
MLTGKQKRYLRGLASLLNPVAIVGKEGFTPEVMKEIKKGIKANELIKIKIGKNSPDEKLEIKTMIEENFNAEIVQIIGRSIVLFKSKGKATIYNLP